MRGGGGFYTVFEIVLFVALLPSSNSKSEDEQEISESQTGWGPEQALRSDLCPNCLKTLNIIRQH